MVTSRLEQFAPKRELRARSFRAPEERVFEVASVGSSLEMRLQFLVNISFARCLDVLLKLIFT